MNGIKSVVILGAGNVAFHLTRALIENTVNVRQIFNRTIERAQLIGENNKVSYTDKISELIKADLYIIACSDSAVEEFSHYIPFDDVLVVHTSGSLPVSVLKGDYRKGVVYPLQTFTQGSTLRYEEIPFFIEAENPEDQENLVKLFERVSNEVNVVDAEKRRNLQMAGVWVGNFVNHLYYIGEQICKENGVGLEVLRPIIEETARKVETMTPYDAQTGPARRGDQIIIEKHLDIIKDSREMQLYKLLTESIQRVYKND